MKTTFDWKKALPFVAAIAIFIGIAMFYCAPALDGKVLIQGDVNNWKGAAQEARAFYDQHGTRTWWTNSMFGGMPTYQITGSLPTEGAPEGSLSIHVYFLRFGGFPLFPLRVCAPLLCVDFVLVSVVYLTP